MQNLSTTNDRPEMLPVRDLNKNDSLHFPVTTHTKCVKDVLLSRFIILQVIIMFSYVASNEFYIVMTPIQTLHAYWSVLCSVTVVIFNCTFGSGLYILYIPNYYF
jgi:hypothetical protein